MSLKRILIVNKTLHPAAVQLLRNCINVQTTVLPYTDEHPDMLPAIRQSLAEGYDGLIWNTKYTLTSEILDTAGTQLKAVSTCSSGLDHVDVQELQRRGIPLGYSHSALGNAVADIAVGLLIAAARRFKEGVHQVHSGTWQFGVQMLLGQDISGSTVGIVGLGSIGQTIVRRLKGFDVARFLYSGRSDKPEVCYGIQMLLGQDISGSTVGIVGLGSIGQTIVRRLKGFHVARFLYSGRNDKPEAKHLGAERVSLEQLLQESDYVVLSCPLSKDTKHLINAGNLQLMKATSILVNIARGEIIDQEALYEVLKEKRIFAAALDVTAPEPLPKDHKLLQLPNCYVIPHMGSATNETRRKMAQITARNILLALEGKPMECPADK